MRPDDVFVDASRMPYGHSPNGSIGKEFSFLLADIVTIWRSLSFGVVHYLYPENTAILSPLLLRILRRRIVYTVHLDSGFWFTRTWKPHILLRQASLRCADKCVVLGRAHEPEFSERLGSNRVFYVPHGYEFGSENPDKHAYRRRLEAQRIVIVGNNYRDFPLLKRIIESRNERNVSFDLIGISETRWQDFLGVPGVMCHRRLSSATYRHLLSRALVMLMPLTFATANNAILEAFDAALPVLASDVHGVTDYVESSDFRFGNATDFWEKYDRLAAMDETTYCALCERARSAAIERFGWRGIREKLERIYRMA